ncbi:MAG: hypothetical protein ABTA24_08495 [Arthrobacter sp.]
MGTHNGISGRTPSEDVLTPSSKETVGIRWVHSGRAQGAPPRPPLKPGQVYVTRRGTVYHSDWCQVVQRTWEFNRPALQVCSRDEAGSRRLCRSCAEEASRS